MLAQILSMLAHFQHDTNIVVTILALDALNQVPKMQNPGYGAHLHLNLYGNMSNRSGAYVRVSN